MLDELKKSPTMGYSEMLVKYCQKWSKSKESFRKDWNLTTPKLDEYQRKLNEAKENLSIKEDLKPLKNGLKTKNERLIILQKLVDDCLTDLTEGKTNDTYFEKGKPKPLRRKMTNLEYNQTRRTLKDLQAEISKIEGDYAPAKSEVSGEIKTSFASVKQEKEFEEFLKDKYNLK